MKTVVITAGACEEEMKSKLPAALHKVCGKEVIRFVLEMAETINADKKIVVWPYKCECPDYVAEGATLIKSLDALNPLLRDSDQVIVIKDNCVPFFNIDLSSFADMLTDDTKQLKLTHDNEKPWALFSYSSAIKELTEGLSENILSVDSIFGIHCKESEESGMLIDSKAALMDAEHLMRSIINNIHIENGVIFKDQYSAYIDLDVTIGYDTIIYPDVIIEAGTSIGNGCIIGPNSRIIKSEIKDDVTVDSSKVVESFIDSKTTVGPFAYLRPGTHLGKSVKIGDFVEVKKSVVGDNSKASHLSYIGDAEVGKNVNIGCGVVFVNYDGKIKNKTSVGDNAFVGSNSNLIAPVTVGDGGYVACGSTITDDVGEDDLAIARARQVNKKGRGKNRYN